MSSPICPSHSKEMKPGKQGGWYCPTKVGDGWCKHRVSTMTEPASNPFSSAPSALPQGPAQVSAAVDAVLSSIKVSPDKELRARALAFAAQIFQGTAQPQSALICAESALNFLMNTEWMPKEPQA